MKTAVAVATVTRVGYIRLREGARPSVLHHGMEVQVLGEDPAQPGKLLVSAPSLRNPIPVLASFITDTRMPAIRENES